ncbi:MAG: molecular chaperone GrpE [Miltoncostaeaceae bacterium]|nr:molecular chaperone GrpE [Miltoncostaeaceae bacterium]
MAPDQDTRPEERRVPFDGAGPGDGPAPAAEPADGLPDPDAPEAGPELEAEEAEGPDPLDEALAERDQYLDALQRLKADFDNYRKRSERDRQALAAATARELVADLLPVLDNLERAVAALPPDDAGLAAGVDMVRAQLAGVLTGRGVAEIAALGAPFDPQVHEAVLSQPSDAHEAGTVMAVVQKGYRQADSVLRPARVVVAASPAA